MGGIQDGFGDSGYDLLEQTIIEKQRLIEIQVSERNQDVNLREDLIQEARITVWKVLEKRPDAPGAYIHASTAKRIAEVLRGGTMTGQPTNQGKPRDPIRRKDRDSFDDPEFLVGASAPDVLGAVEMAYHEGQILDAIRALPPRYQEYVILRFWAGWTPGELAPVIGVKATNQARMWKEAIRPVLAERLAHLVDA